MYRRRFGNCSTITNFAIIDTLTLTFAPGFNVLTGETGTTFCSGFDLASFIPLMTRSREPVDEWDHIVAADLAIAELLEQDGVAVVEWGDVVAGAFGDHLEVRFDLDPDDEDARDVTLSATGRSWALRWERIEASVEAFAC